MNSSPNGAGNVPNFNMGHEIGAFNGGTILFDWDGPKHNLTLLENVKDMKNTVTW